MNIFHMQVYGLPGFRTGNGSQPLIKPTLIGYLATGSEVALIRAVEDEVNLITDEVFVRYPDAKITTSVSTEHKGKVVTVKVMRSTKGRVTGGSLFVQPIAMIVLFVNNQVEERNDGRTDDDQDYPAGQPVADSESGNG